jgi:hypothetical protein
MKELDGYVDSLYDQAHSDYGLAYSNKPSDEPRPRGNLMDTLTDLQLDFKVRVWSGLASSGYAFDNC